MSLVRRREDSKNEGYVPGVPAPAVISLKAVAGGSPGKTAPRLRAGGSRFEKDLFAKSHRSGLCGPSGATHGGVRGRGLGGWGGGIRGDAEGGVCLVVYDGRKPPVHQGALRAAHARGTSGGPGVVTTG